MLTCKDQQKQSVHCSLGCRLTRKSAQNWIQKNVPGLRRCLVFPPFSQCSVESLVLCWVYEVDQSEVGSRRKDCRLPSEATPEEVWKLARGLKLSEGNRCDWETVSVAGLALPRQWVSALLPE